MNCSCLHGLGESHLTLPCLGSSHLTILCAEGEHLEDLDLEGQVPPYEDRLGPDG